VTATPTTVIADAGYWQTEQMQRIAANGMQVLVPPESGLRAGARPGWDCGYYAFMRRVLSTDLGRSLDAKREPSIEPVFGQTNATVARIAGKCRGRAAVRSE
jgi:hypothetical protein